MTEPGRFVPAIRVGQGYDVHRLTAVAEATTVRLGGISIPCNYRIEAHSDGDVLLHALADALLGAAGLRDIGHHFPPDDPQWEDADSGDLLRHCVRMVSERGWDIVNVDLTLVAQYLRLSDWVEKISRQIGDYLGLDSTAVGVKATTTEGLGALGRGEGIAALAVALLAAKDSQRVAE